jgi:hypothetical protein
MSRFSLLALFILANLCASSVCGEELQTFVSRCQDAGLKARIQKSFQKRCLVEVAANSDVNAIPPSGDIEIEVALLERAIDRTTIVQVAKDRKIVSFDFNGCQLTPMAIEALRAVAPNSIAFTKSELVERTSERGIANDSERNGTFEIAIKDCNPLLADRLLREFGFAKRTLIDMPSGYRVTLSAENKQIEQLVINGCTLSVRPDFVETSNISEIAVTNSKLSANTISRFLRLKRLSVFSIYRYEIDASEWEQFDLPPKCADGLVVLTSGKLLDYFKDHLDSNVDLPGRKRVVK